MEPRALSLRRFWRFNLVGAAGIAVQLASLAALTAAGLHYLPATIIAVAAALAHNFEGHRHWTWADRPGAAGRWPIGFLRFAGANGMVSWIGNPLLTALLIEWLALPVVAANAAAIAALSLINFRLGDRCVFARGPTRDQPYALLLVAGPRSASSRSHWAATYSRFARARSASSRSNNS
jgi:dolichol-phosphate mannosyltransferase